MSSVNNRVKRRGMVLMAGLLALGLSMAAWGGPGRSRQEIPLSASSIIIELNATDDDSGIQIFLDGEGWKRMSVFDPGGRRVFDVKGKGNIGETGGTELFLESAEPGFDELPLDEFLERFPEGEYQFLGVSVDGDRLTGSAMLTHALPEGAVLLTPVEGSSVDPEDTVVSWEPVPDPPGSSIVEYQVIVERADIKRTFSAHVPASVTSVKVPPTFLERGKPYKYEVLAIEESGNQTLKEAEFETAE
jgi:hypothetical protein